MGLTVHRYEFNDSYIVGELNDRYRIDFDLANSFHKDMIDLYYGLTHILSRFFHKDDEYGTLLEARQEIMVKLNTASSEFDFVVDLCNGEPNMNIFYKSDSIYSTLKKVVDNRQFLIDRNMVDDPVYLQRLEACLAFAQKAKAENNLIHFWNQ